MRATDTPNRSSIRPLLGVAIALLAGMMAIGLATGVALAASPASHQYKDQVPGAGGHNGGGGGKGGQAKGGGATKGGQTKGGGPKGGQGTTGQQGSESGALASLNDSGDGGGGLGTLGIILIILGVVLAGALVVAWLRSRREVGPDAGP